MGELQKSFLLRSLSNLRWPQTFFLLSSQNSRPTSAAPKASTSAAAKVARVPAARSGAAPVAGRDADGLVGGADGLLSSIAAGD